MLGASFCVTPIGITFIILVLATLTTSSNAITVVKDNLAVLSETFRDELRASGIADIPRSVKIKAERVTSAEDLLLTDTKAGHTSKLVHFQRHGQGIHNVAHDKWMSDNNPIDWNSADPSKNPFVREELLDAPLTEVGRKQCMERQTDCSLLSPEIVLVSPLLRAIQSAELSWGKVAHNGWDRIPWVAHEGCREEAGLLLCNKRRPLSETKRMYPGIDFSLVPTEHDNLFLDDRRESDLEKANRVYEFLLYLKELPQREITVVGHSAWLFNMCNAVVDCGNDENLTSWFLTSEIRTMRLTFIESEGTPQ